MKKKLLLITLCIIATLSAAAQTQQGIIKTPGRLGKNGRVITGDRLPGATVHIKGRNAVVSGTNGTFSFPIPANKFLLDSVKLNNYVLVDPEAVGRQYTYSNNPIILLMEKPERLADNLIANEQKIRQTLQEKLQAKEAKIEALREQNKITQEEYRKAMQQLYAEQESNEKLIKEMAERYSQIDFDQLDEFNQRISDCIINGRLTEADSLLRSKGDIHTRIDRLNKQHEANAEIRDNLEKSEYMEQKNREDIAQDCYHHHELFLMNHQNDSAVHYLELRADLDTSNIEWQCSAGLFINNYMANYPLAIKYFERGLKQAQNQYGEECTWVGIFYNNIGLAYSNSDYIKALEYYFKALSISEIISDTDYRLTANTNNNIGLAYYNLEDYSNALQYFLKALVFFEKESEKELPSIAMVFNNIGGVYFSQKKYDLAIEYFLKAIDIQEKTLGVVHPETATSYNNIGMVYKSQGDDTKALSYYLKALAIREKVFKTNHPETATTYNNIGEVYDNQGDYNRALEFYFKALNTYEKALGANHPYCAIVYTNICMVYYTLNDYDKSLEYCTKALNSYSIHNGPDHPSTQESKRFIEFIKWKQSQQ